MAKLFNQILTSIDGFVWGVPLIVLILAVGVFLTIRVKGLQIRLLPRAIKELFVNEKSGDSGEVSSFAALCTALSATIGTGNIVGVATALVAGGPGALFWMWVAAFVGMATKYSECLLAVKYRTVAEDGHIVGGPFYYIEKGMGPKWRWLAKIFAFFGVCRFVWYRNIYTDQWYHKCCTDIFDPDKTWTVHMFWNGLFLDSCNRRRIVIYLCRTGSYRWYQTYFQCFAGCRTVYGGCICSSCINHSVDISERFRERSGQLLRVRLVCGQQQVERWELY